MKNFTVPTRAEVSEKNQEILAGLEKAVGFVPNLYSYYSKSDTALADYLALANRKTSLKAKEKEVVNLVVSQVNGCEYCQSAHTAIGKMNGFSDEQILELRKGSASFDSKLDALVKLAKSITVNRGSASEEVVQGFFDAGYSEITLIDVVILIADKTISNYIHNLAQFPIDFPAAPKLEEVEA
ncbi:uncharacterized peroxidase-related enzyme [Algoriphagus ornithinivorans]|uniref:Uncharacterized peroxidase-related enzyme n=1 Tax=Algoriphagus ornithinivorans TaxID=226506 RepID=A0A1I5DNT3_9BACT|nr:carboxymuconolactone decarboxylase family protein [Algoriphagus ornithinivorans]SFO00909.1 uncharacterized peroxidase-related enzyme [Algoriphagus ornithinivorans]